MSTITGVDTKSWRARLELDFVRLNQRTILQRRQHYGPLQVQRPFYPEDDGTCHVYILHPPGGVVAGDELILEATVNPYARVLLTTPAAGKFYRSSGATAHQQQFLKIAEGACLEWFPQETIIYDGARLSTGVRVELGDNAHFTGWEILCLGRPASAETFTSGACRQHFTIWHKNTPLFLDEARYNGASELLSAPWGLQNKAVSAILVSTARNSALVERIRTELTDIINDRESFSVTQLNDVIVCRYLGFSADRARAIFTRAWALLRLTEQAKPFCPPRIWNT